MRTLLMRFCH